ncbi:hypothetical protein PRK78_003942 [Emydomyces testavorans]|uniref:Transcriptional regulatory protein DEP1 n=1 Tax=Emydomyces testavorans TaxID=2070801 RepID=A0AAF0DHT6_9EURO|nr:hypothetical protein PRK78_003942 [Emydomyces testavorans]
MESPHSVGPVPRLASGAIASVFPDSLLSDDIHDDDRSSSLSEIEEGLDEHQLEDMSPRREKIVASEVDSEAETERLEDSPNRLRNRTSIVLSARTYGTSPSKLAQSTTYDNLDKGAVNEAQASPTEPSRNMRINGVGDPSEETAVDGADSPSAPQAIVGKKRKRGNSVDNDGEELDDDEPLRKRRGSPSNDGVVVAAEQDSAVPHAPQRESKNNEVSSNGEISPINDEQENDSRQSALRGRKGKKGKRKGKKVKETYEDLGENGQDHNQANGNEQMVEDEENGDAVDGVDDPEATLKMEETMKKTTAMDVLLSLERQFAALRDKIYDDRIASINEELAQLEKPNPTHPEFLRQLQIIQNHRDEKIRVDETLFAYKLRSLCIKSQAERSQVNSSYYQNARDIRERYLKEVSEHHYRVQHDRFQTTETNVDYGIPFPTRRLQQVAQQTAYNTEVGILAGTAKYVGFPSAPDMKGLQHNEIEDDFVKLGLSLQPTNVDVLPPAPLPQHNRPAASAVAATRQAAEEKFLEQTPWANPQHPVHGQFRHQMQQDRISDSQGYPNLFSTPAGQQRVVDLSALNGSASTIPEHPSAPNSTAADTPYDYDRARRIADTSITGPSNSHYADNIDGPSTFRSLSSSPLEVRRPHPQKSQPQHEIHRGSPAPSSIEPMGPPSSTRDILYSPSSSSTVRPGRFGVVAKEEESVSSVSSRQKPLVSGSVPQSASIPTGASERNRIADP